MSISIEQADYLPEQIHILAEFAHKEGFQHIQRLVDEYQQEKNLFNAHGEFLLLAYDDEKLVACGGLNIQMSDNGEPSRIGRVRRFYVMPNYRKLGLGRGLLQELEKRAKANFSALCLHTDGTSGAHFFPKQNYVFVENHSNYNYFKYLV